ncbi:MAG: DinB family protein [Ilumatobacteraceae bacterium]
MTIVPDYKSWTWVLERPCPECGFDASAVELGRAATTIRSMNDAWDNVLRRADVRDRPTPSVWSPLEYACHVRDVYRVFDGRLSRMLAEEHPKFANWDQNASAVDDRYGEQHPATVATDLVAAAHTLADRYDTVAAGQWGRTSERSDGSVFTVDSFTRYLLHDPIHHLWDVGEPFEHPTIRR